MFYLTTLIIGNNFFQIPIRDFSTVWKNYLPYSLRKFCFAHLLRSQGDKKTANIKDQQFKDFDVTKNTINRASIVVTSSQTLLLGRAKFSRWAISENFFLKKLKKIFLSAVVIGNVLENGNQIDIFFKRVCFILHYKILVSTTTKF